VNQVIQGDCLIELPKIESGSADMILADVPYGTTQCKWDSVIPLEPMWEQLKRIIKPNGAIVMTASQPFTTVLIHSNLKMFKYCWVWNKMKAANFPCVKIQPLKIHEDIVVFNSSQKSYNPQMVTRGKLRKKGGYFVKGDVAVMDGAPPKISNQYYPKSIIDMSIANNKGSGLHPTQKPVALMEYLIKTYTNPGELVLDFTAGSGTTGVAAQKTGRNYILIEKEPKYVAICEERLSQQLLNFS
jgi:site-specific DNA-methyltransferase (adenine-specific)